MGLTQCLEHWTYSATNICLMVDYADSTKVVGLYGGVHLVGTEGDVGRPLGH